MSKQSYWLLFWGRLVLRSWFVLKKCLPLASLATEGRSISTHAFGLIEPRIKKSPVTLKQCLLPKKWHEQKRLNILFPIENRLKKIVYIRKKGLLQKCPSPFRSAEVESLRQNTLRYALSSS